MRTEKVQYTEFSSQHEQEVQLVLYSTFMHAVLHTPSHFTADITRFKLRIILRTVQKPPMLM